MRFDRYDIITAYALYYQEHANKYDARMCALGARVARLYRGDKSLDLEDLSDNAREIYEQMIARSTTGAL